MKLQRYGTGVKGYGFSGMQKDDEGKFCAAKDVEALESENAALHAECDRLTAMLGPQRVLEAHDVREGGFYFWTTNPEKGWEAIMRVIERKHGFRFSGDEWDGSNYGLYGYFIGPIRFPEVQG